MEVGKRNTKYPICPICGKPDWCDIESDVKGNEYIICKRNKEGGNISGYDSKLYVFVKVTDLGNYMFEEITQRINRKGKKFISNDNFFNYKPKKVVKSEPEILAWTNERLNKVYRKMLNLLVLEPRHKQYLLNEGWTEAEILHFCIKSMPPTDADRKSNNVVTDNPKRYTIAQELFKEFGTLDGVPGAYYVENEKSGFWTLAGSEGIIFPIIDIEDNIYRLRIRLDNPPSTGGKYRNLSSHHLKELNGAMVNIYNKGCSSGNHLSIEDSFCKNKLDYTLCYITEGEKKAKIVNSRLKAPCISVPGVSSYMLLFEKDSTGKSIIQKMLEKGTKMFVVAFDADKATNKNVSDCEKHILENLEKEGVQRGIANWNIDLGKGIDDVLLKGYAIQYDFIN